MSLPAALAAGEKQQNAWRPGVYAGARWVFWAQLLAWGFILPAMEHPPWEPPRYLVLGLLVLVALCIAFWVNHVRLLRAQPAMTTGVRLALRVAGSGLYDFCVLLAATVPVTYVFTLFFLSADGRYAPASIRASVRELIHEMDPLQGTIEARALAKSSLADTGTGLRVSPSVGVRGGYVTADGVIVFAADAPPVMVTLTPAFHQPGGVVWTCSAQPEKYAPTSCTGGIR